MFILAKLNNAPLLDVLLTDTSKMGKKLPELISFDAIVNHGFVYGFSTNMLHFVKSGG